MQRSKRRNASSSVSEFTLDELISAGGNVLLAAENRMNKFLKPTSAEMYEEYAPQYDFTAEDCVARSAENDDGTDDPDDLDWCEVCGSARYTDEYGKFNMIICDWCDANFHFECLHLVAVPTVSPWFCPRCTNKSANDLEERDNAVRYFFGLRLEH